MKWIEVMFVRDIKEESEKWGKFDSSILKKKNLMKLGILKYGINKQSMEWGKCVTVEDWNKNFPEHSIAPKVIDVYKIAPSNLQIYTNDK